MHFSRTSPTVLKPCASADVLSTHARAVSLPPLRPETERRVNPTPRSRMIKRDRCVAIGNGTESSSVSSDEQLSFSARRRWGGKKQKGPFSGNVPPSNISPCGHRSTAATFEQNRQMSICHRVGMCYFYLGYFYLHLFPWRQVTTLCLNT